MSPGNTHPPPDGQGNRLSLSAGTALSLWLQRSVNWISYHELWFLGVTAPFLLFPSRWTWGALLVIALTWLCRYLVTGRLTVATGVDMPILLLLLMAGIGLWVSTDPASSQAALWRIVLGVAIFYGLANGLRSEIRLLRLPVALILCSLLLTLLTLVGTGWDAVRLFHLPQVYEHLPRLIRDLQDQNPFHPRVMGMALATMFPLPAALLLFFPSKRYRLWSGISVFVIGMTILLTQSLQAAVGVAAALLFLGACWNRWLLMTVPLILGMLFIGLWRYGLPQVANVLLSPANPLGIAITLRLDIWSRALAMIHDMPYTGVGLDMFPLMQSNFYPGVMIGPEPHAHQLFLQIAVDLGLPGLLAFLWLLIALVFAAARTCWRGQEAQQHAILLGAMGSIVSYVASGFLDTIWAAKPSVLIWFVLGLVAALCVSSELRPRTTIQSTLVAYARRCLPALLILLVMYPGFLIAPDAPRVNWSIIQANRLLLFAQAGRNNEPSLATVATDLREAVRMQADNARLYSLLGRVYSWLGKYQDAMDAFLRVVELDGRDAVARYAPFEDLRRLLVGEKEHDPWVDAIWVYSHWVARFPQRAEPVVLVALVREQHQDDPKGAAAVVKSGIEKGAQPKGLLLYYLDRLNAQMRVEP
nr:O-antigen ligase family protein [Chloroflexota bacterium]